MGGRKIALFRGINVGGKNTVTMADLVADLESLGLREVRTYIQSGNAVFRTSARSTSKLADRIATTIKRRHGFQPGVLVLDVDQLQRAADSNPFPKAEKEPKSLHLFFLDSPPSAVDTERVSAAASDSERFELSETVFYLHAPDGIGRSKLAKNVERFLGVTATGRNWRTVQKLLEMATEEV